MLARLYFLGPELFRIYRNFERSERYNPNTFEHYGSKIIFCMTLAYNVGFYFVTPWLSYQILFKRGEFFQPATFQQGFRYLTGIGFVYMVAVTLRAIGRATNPVYKEFLVVLDKAIKEPTQVNKLKLQQFDSGIGPWPVDFSMKDGKPAGKRIQLERRPGGVENILSFPNRVLAWLMTHTFGLKLVYPGSIQLLQASLGDALVEGRAKWLIEKGGRRNKLQTFDNNQIDSMFFDRRESANPNGKILVITCEGNAGFYEIGFLGSPLDAGFSVLGWNQPGFGESSGSPFPSQTMNAMDAVVQFAIQKLNFTPDQIIFHGWSIGGFPVSWAAMNYPEVKAVFLDATFDNLLPLATARMPQSLEGLVHTAIEEYMNLNVIDHLVKYDGPIKLIRRSHDEIITTISGHRSTNRGNDLLIGLLRYRYPEVIGPTEEQLLLEYLTYDEAGQSNLLALRGVHESQMMDLLQTHADDNNGSSRTYPSTLGLDEKPETKAKLALFLASRYMTDFDAVHCAALPAQLFTLPWEPPAPNHNDFVKI